MIETLVLQVDTCTAPCMASTYFILRRVCVNCRFYGQIGVKLCALTKEHILMKILGRQ